MVYQLFTIGKKDEIAGYTCRCKRRSKKKTETVPDSVPTIAQATLWLAELGGYTGKSSGGPPGTITISRGLAKLRSAADAIAAFLAADDEKNG